MDQPRPTPPAGPGPTALPAADEEVSYLVRMDFVISDAYAFIDAAQTAAREVLGRPSDDGDVATVEDAFHTYVQAHGLDALIEDAPGLDIRTVVSEVAYELDEVSIVGDEPPDPD